MVTREALAAALHDLYGAGLCLDPSGPHPWATCAAAAQWTMDADTMLAHVNVFGTPPPAPTEEAT